MLKIDYEWQNQHILPATLTYQPLIFVTKRLHFSVTRLYLENISKYVELSLQVI